MRIRFDFWVVVGALILLFIVFKDRVMSVVGNFVVRGMRNNNPFNLRNSPKYKWKGQIGVDDKEFCVFDTLENGVRAGVRNLQNGYFSKGLTIRQILEKYAPSFENDTENYIRHVIKYNPDFSEDFIPITDEHKLSGCRGIVRMDVGYDAVGDEMIKRYL
jgi:hypothetical protein